MFFLIPCWFSNKVQVVNERVDIFLFMSNFATNFFALPIMRCGCSPALELRWCEFKTSPKCPDFSYFQLGVPRFLVSLAYTLGLAPFLYRFCEFLFRDPMESSDMASQPLSDRVTPKLLLGCTDCVTVMPGEPQVWFSLVASGGLGNMRS